MLLKFVFVFSVFSGQFLVQAPATFLSLSRMHILATENPVRCGPIVALSPPLLRGHFRLPPFSTQDVAQRPRSPPHPLPTSLPVWPERDADAGLQQAGLDVVNVTARGGGCRPPECPAETPPPRTVPRVHSNLQGGGCPFVVQRRAGHTR